MNTDELAFQAAIRDFGVFSQCWPEATRGVITGRCPANAYRELLFDKIKGIKNVVSFA